MIFMGLMFFFSFTYLRQVMAAIILWFSLPYIAKRQYLPFFALVLTATLVHNSAMYFAVLYFIPRKKFPTQNIIIVMGILLFIGIFFSAASLFTFYGDVVESAANKATSYENLASSEVRIAYIIESVLFLGILFANYDKVGTSTSDCVITNAYLMFCGVLLLFCRSTDGGRIAWHSAIGVILLITRLCEKRNTDLLRVFNDCRQLRPVLPHSRGMGHATKPLQNLLHPGTPRRRRMLYELRIQPPIRHRQIL